jgi:prophage tail gpP-like protein
MKNDEVILLVAKARVDKFVSYTIDADLYSPEGSFQFECDSKYDVNKGDTCQIFVNRKCVMSGLIDTVRRSLSRSGPKMEIEGRSVASILADSSVTKFGTMPTSLPQLAERLVRDLPFLSRKDFVFNSGADRNFRENQCKYVELTPGDSVFDVLKKAANSNGFLFWASPAGELVFDKPVEHGKAEFKIHAFENGEEMDYIDGSVAETLNGQHSLIKVIGESQDDNDIKYVAAEVKNDDFPFYRPLVVNWNENEGPAKKTAELQLATEKASAIQLEYTVRGHTQNGKPWAINAFCDVEDHYNGAVDSFLIKRVTFTLTRNEGRRTRLELQPGGSL